MKKLLSLFVAISLLSFSIPAFAATTTDPACKSFAYGYMADGKVYMMLSGSKFGPFESVEQLKTTLTSMGPQFKENMRRYLYVSSNGSNKGYLTFQEELGECNPYALDMDTVADWNLKITDLFRRLNVRFGSNTVAYKTALYNALDKVKSKIATGNGSPQTLEILKLIRDRFQKKLDRM